MNTTLVELTREEAIALGESGWWTHCDPHTIVAYQLYQDLLCMPFGEFHAAVEKALGRSVWTHEFGSTGRARLQAEFEGRMPRASMEEVVALAQDLVGEDRVLLVGTRRAAGRMG